MSDKRTWGNSTLKFDPKKEICWSISRKGNIINHGNLPSYGLPREEMPDGKTQKNKKQILANMVQKDKGKVYRLDSK